MELDEEDSHLCLRCNQTIIGLQNYVNHRQSSCSKSHNELKPSSKPFETNFAFLSPHSSKKMENFTDYHFDDEREEEVEPNSSDTQFKQYDHNFFSSLELQYLSKRELPHMNQQKSFSHRILTRKATAEIMAQNGDEWIDETAAARKDDSAYKFLQQNESESEEESEESEPDVPPNYTQGKWKPGLRPTNNFTGGKLNKIPSWDDNDSSNDANLDKSSDLDNSNPPPNHTKGKWVPGSKTTNFESSEREHFFCSFCSRNLASRPIYERHLKSNLHLKRMKEQNDLEEAAEALPHIDMHSSQLKPERVITSIPTEHAEEKNQIEEKRKIRSCSKVTCEVCDMKLPIHLLGNHLISHFHYRKMLQSTRKSFDIVLNNFHKIIIQSPFQCQPCKFYFNTQSEFMRHWKSKTHNDCIDKVEGGTFYCSLCKFDNKAHDKMTDHLTSEKHQKVVTLINRSKPIIIRRLISIFCMKCSLEFRYNFQLLRHLEICAIPSFDAPNICDICKKAFQSTLSLQKHKKNVHNSLIFFCTECQKTFSSAKESKTHRKTSKHKALALRKRMRQEKSTASCLNKICPVCREEKLDILELRDHILHAHPEQQFSCGRCGMKFPLAQDISRHVRDKLCKFFSADRVLQHSITSTNLKKTDSTKFERANDKSTEILSRNSELNFNNILSPAPFAIPQENEHEFGFIIEQEVCFACKLCEFSSSSHAEFLFHETLHTLPSDHCSKDKIECQICQKSFVSQSLREHLRQHTNERIFDCPIDGCSMTFTRKANVKNHITNVHEGTREVCKICGKKFQSKFILEQHKFVHRSQIDTKTFPCKLPNCIYIGRSLAESRNHLLTHNDERIFICDQLNCNYRGQTMEQLRSHSRKHQQLKLKFSCEHCDYKTKFSGHLKRHTRVHDEAAGKIYKCPYCEYSCNISENLRKHVLVSNKHPGRFMYECDYCADETTKFKHNAMKEYRKHLKLSHNVTNLI